jgi:homocitrate synthase
MDDVDSLLRIYHSGIQSGELQVGQKEALDRLLRKHRAEAQSTEVLSTNSSQEKLAVDNF